MNILHYFLIIFIGCLEIITALHALLYKRDPRASWAWIVTCILLPPIGPVLYFLLGINRVRTKAKKLKWYWPWFQSNINHEDIEELDHLENTVCHFLTSAEVHNFAHISEAITRRPLLKNNSIKSLYNGEEAYPEMLKAINEASQYIFLASYIFDSSRVGKEFLQALSKAYQRGIDTRVMIDGFGDFYSYPRMSKLLAKQDIPFSNFLPLKLFPPSPFLNLRNHRKLLIVDGKTGFTGGMNIREKHLAKNENNPRRIQDLHFKLNGPIVNQMEEVFLEDWAFCTGDYHQKPKKPTQSSGEAICRCITVGPNQDLNKLSMILTGCASLAKTKISIVSPYFLPTRELIGALQAAAFKGVQVNIVLPQKNNLPFVHWATRNMLWELLECGVKVFYQPPPFSHTKLFLVDDYYAQVGSANLDPRSLRLNFELVVEVYNEAFVKDLNSYVEDIILHSKETTLQEVDSRPLPIRLRDSVCWLFSPYF